MDRNHLFSMALAAATMGLTACGGSDNVASALGPDGKPVTPAAVACTAPEASELRSMAAYSSVCIPATAGGGSSRYDLETASCCAATIVKVDFTDANCTTGASQAARVNLGFVVNNSTTTVANLAADGVTPVTGSGRTVTLTLRDSFGTFPAGVPLVSNGDFVLCKTTPASTTTARVLPAFLSRGSRETTMTPTFVLRSSNAGTSTMNTSFGFDGGPSSTR